MNLNLGNEEVVMLSDGADEDQDEDDQDQNLKNEKEKNLIGVEQ